jgi:zinc transport system permease protein
MSLLVMPLIAILLASIAAGIVGTLAVSHRMVSLGGGLAHAAYGGVGLAFLLGWAPLPVAIVFTLGVALLMAYLIEHSPERADTLIGVVWAMGMAFGILCIDLSRNYVGDLMSVLFGSLLAIPRQDLVALAVLDAVLALAVWRFRRELLALAVDPEFAEVAGFPVRAFRIGLLSVLSVAVVLLMRVTGLVLLVAFLSIPGALAVRWSRSMGRAIWTAIGLSLVFGLAGLGVSWAFDLSTGACIIAVAGTTYLVATLRVGK